MSQTTNSRSSGTRGRTLVLALALVLSGSITIAGAQVPNLTHGWCRYPQHAKNVQATRQSKVAVRGRVVTVPEVEPNEDAALAQFLAVSSAIGNEVDATVTGSVSEGGDNDFFRVFFNKGDVVGLEVSTNRDPYDDRPDLGLDPTVAICDLTGEPFVENDNAFWLDMVYPPSSPLPFVENPLYPFDRRDSALSWVVPETGDYMIRVASHEGSRRGDYELKVVLRRPSFETQAVGATQIFFLDFDGVQDLNARYTFGDGYYLTDLSGLRSFLPDWGLTDADESAVIDAVVATFTERFDNIRAADLNGERDIDFIDGHMDFEVRNSRDHADPWGQPNVTRIIIGGTISELGILTIGIAGSIDPGNFAREDTAVVLLDLLSIPEPADPNDPWYPVYLGNSINGIPRAGGVSIIDAIGRTVGTIAAHEAVHTLGLWHTDNSNAVFCLIDAGGNFISYAAGAGPDGVLGTGDDQMLELVPDEYDSSEGVATGLEFTNVRAAFALSTGKTPAPPPPPPDTEVAQVSISAMPEIGQAPLTVSFAGGGIDPAGGQFIVFNWSFGDQTTGSGSFVKHTYTKPGTYIVTLSGTTNNAATAQAAAEVVVLSQPNELPQGRIIASPTKGDAPLMVLFQADAEDPDGEIIGYGWDFGDGQSGTGQVVDHVYVIPGVYVVTLTVTDNLGAAQRVTTAITVLGESAGGANANEPQGGSGLPIPILNGCGTGTPSALAATLAGLMGMALMRRRH